MALPGNAPGLKTLLASGMVILLVPFSVTAATDKVQQIGGVIIPQAFSQALQDGMSIPLFIHLEGSTGTQDDQRIGNAFIWLDNGVLRVRQIQLEENDNNATVSEQTRKQLTALANEAFSKDPAPATSAAGGKKRGAGYGAALAQRRYRSVQRQHP